MDTININGTECIKTSDIRVADTFDNWKHVCVIATNGWIFEGYQDEALTTVTGNVGLADAHVVRKWRNGLGIGGLVDSEHKDEYVLDRIGSMEIFADAVIACIELRW